MSALSPRAEHRPTQYYYDSSSGRVDVIVDVSPAAREDLTVLVGDSRIELRIEDAEGTDERSFRTPTATWRFDDEHRAVYNNGVLTVSVGTTEIESVGAAGAESVGTTDVESVETTDVESDESTDADADGPSEPES